MSKALETLSEKQLNEYLQIPLEEYDKYLAENSLREFVEQAWHIVEPKNIFIPGWHIDAICDHLQAVSEGHIKKLIINIPPRHLKSLCVSVFWPAWEWTKSPSCRWVFASYAEKLSIRDSRKCRYIIKSPWYQRFWGDRYRLVSDQDAKLRYDTDKMGYRLATSVMGVATGEGGDRIVCLPYDAMINVRWWAESYSGEDGFIKNGYIEGRMTIGNIVDSEEKVEILSYNHETKKVEYKSIEEYQTSFLGERDLIEIELEDGSIMKCTEDHPVYVDGIGYVLAGELEIGNGLLIQD